MQHTYELFLKELGARLRQMRKERGWTYRSMVVDHSFHISHWQGFENGKGISLRSLFRVCEVFQISLEELVRGLDSPAAHEKSASQEETHVSAPQVPKRAKPSKKTAGHKKLS
ncbi:helix-turn-helix domain-containing protein [Granulicella aggregans]|uniref:helix-turn-helix domain-containing protein n=1 Tax=Granulicella aggregans TaxID=474949 RepID=UPI003D7C26DE